MEHHAAYEQIRQYAEGTTGTSLATTTGNALVQTSASAAPPHVPEPVEALQSTVEQLGQTLSHEQGPESPWSPKLFVAFLQGALEHYLPGCYEELLQHPKPAETLAGLLGNLNGAERVSLGERIGEAIATSEYTGHLTKQQADRITRFWISASEKDAKSKSHILGAHVLRSRCAVSAREMLKRIGSDEAVTCVSDITEGEALDSAHNVAASLSSAMRTNDWLRTRKLAFGVSQFHEDRIFGTIVADLLKRVESHDFRIVHSKWGQFASDEGEVAIAIMHTQLAKQRHAMTSMDLYRFRGYCAFARSDWLADLRSSSPNDVPSSIQKAAARLTERVDEQADIDNMEFPVDLTARAWIASAGGLTGRNRCAPTYHELRRHITNAAKPLGPSNLPPSPTQFKDDYEGAFEAFVRGDIPVFMGGAIHARLLSRWWASADSDSIVVPLLNPKDFEDLNVFRTNVLAFNPRVFKEQDRSEEMVSLEENVSRLFHLVARAMYRIATSLGKELHPPPPVNELVPYLTRILTPNGGVDHNQRWSFVSDTDDLRALLCYDNDYSLSEEQDE